jgi:hypothetical protein
LSRLLEAHEQHVLACWQGDAAPETVRAHVATLFEWCATVKLDEIVTREQILGVIDRYVVELRVSGGITELMGEMSRVVFGSQLAKRTRVDEIVAPESYEEFADKVVALDGVRRELIALVAQTATFASINARMLARSLLDMLAKAIPLPLDAGVLAAPLAELAERWGRRVLPGLERRAIDLLASYLDQHREGMKRAIEKHLLSVVDAERVRSLLDELWDSIAPLRLAEVFALLGEQDIEDFVVLVFEFWQRYRKTAFFRRISVEMTDHFFRKYGAETLAALIDDMGVDERMVSDELNGFLRPMLQHAATGGALERFVRSQLEPFYRSPAALNALASQ